MRTGPSNVIRLSVLQSKLPFVALTVKREENEPTLEIVRYQGYASWCPGDVPPAPGEPAIVRESTHLGEGDWLKIRELASRVAYQGNVVDTEVIGEEIVVCPHGSTYFLKRVGPAGYEWVLDTTCGKKLDRSLLDLCRIVLEVHGGRSPGYCPRSANEQAWVGVGHSWPLAEGPEESRKASRFSGTSSAR